MSARIIARRKPGTKPRPAAERFAAKYAVVGECWIWQGAHNGRGYGQFLDSGRRKVGAHRFAYEQAHGPIAPGLHIDHLCRNVSCVNPAHLEAVTQQENNRRQADANRSSSCPMGHEFTPENTHISRKGYRQCRACWGRWRTR